MTERKYSKNMYLLSGNRKRVVKKGIVITIRLLQRIAVVLYLRS